jgi:hypothetical protein
VEFYYKQKWVFSKNNYEKNTIKIIYIYIAYGKKSLKLFEHFFCFKKSKILWHVLKKDIT